MKGTEHFKEIIQNYLEQRKAEDALFREKAGRINRPIDDIITAILNYVQKSGCNGFSDEEIFGLATHFAEEETIEIGKPSQLRHAVFHGQPMQRAYHPEWFQGITRAGRCQ